MTTFQPSDLQEQCQTIQTWASELDALFQRIAHRFARPEAREHAHAYLQGLLSPVERKNGWQLAEFVGDKTPYGFQHLLGRAIWDADQVRDDLTRYLIETLGDPQGVLVVDETGFFKKGDKSCGVARQYSGTAGRIENCQIGVFLGYASPKGYTLLDRQLYLPKEWTHDKDRCQQADIPKEIAFATKPKMARALLERAFLAGMPARFVTADSVYGDDRSLQLWLQARKQAYVLAVSGKECVWIGFAQWRVKALLAQIPDAAWQILSAGAGTKGPRFYEWTRIPLNGAEAPQWQRWLLVRRSLSDPSELAGYIAFAPADTDLETLVGVAGTRWTIEMCFEAAKGEVGLDEYEVRSWQGWYRHITLSMVAHAFLTVMRAHTPEVTLKKGHQKRAGRNSLQEFTRSRGLLCA